MYNPSNSLSTYPSIKWCGEKRAQTPFWDNNSSFILVWPSHFLLGDCVLTTTYLINRFPSTVLSGKSPHEVTFKSPHSYQHLRAFGCLCYVNTPKPLQYKFKPRSSACVFIGYPFSKKGYTVLQLDTKKITVSRDIIFYGSIWKPYIYFLSS